jgi:hypothetical protein
MKSIRFTLFLLITEILLCGIVAAQTSAFEVKDGATSLLLVDTNGDLTVKGKVKNGYGEMYINNNSTATTIGTINTWYEIGNFVTGSVSGWAFSASSLTASTGSSGMYFVSFSTSFFGGSNDEYDIAISINDVIQNNMILRRKLGTGGDVGVAAGCGIVSITDGDVIKLEIRNVTVGADATIKQADISIFRL